MGSDRQSRQEKRMRAVKTAGFRLKQTLARIDWGFDTLEPEIAKFLSRATLPEPPAETIIEWEHVEDELAPPPEQSVGQRKSPL